MTTAKHILITDDDEGILDSFRLYFEQKGFQVTLFADGNLLLADDFILPDIIVLDKQLSGVDGLDICRHLKAQERTRPVPVIMLSATPSIDRLAKAAGTEDFLEKPFRMSALLEKIRYWLGLAENNITG